MNLGGNTYFQIKDEYSSFIKFGATDAWTSTISIPPGQHSGTEVVDQKNMFYLQGNQ